MENLIIENKNKLDLTSFCNYLKKVMINEFINMADKKKLKVYDDYLNKLNLNYRFSKVKYNISTYNCIISSFNEMKILTREEEVIMMFDDIIFIPNLNAKFIDIIKLVTYGNLQLPSYDIISRILNKIADDLDKIYSGYLARGDM